MVKQLRFNFNQKRSPFIDHRNDVLTAAARRLSGLVVVLDDSNLGSTKALLQAGVRPSRVHAFTDRNRKRFSWKVRQLGATPHVGHFRQLPERLPAGGAELVYYDGCRGSPANVFEDLEPLLRRCPPKALMVTFVRRCSQYWPDTTKVLGLLSWLASEGFAPAGGWAAVTRAVSTDGKAFNLFLDRFGDGRLAQLEPMSGAAARAFEMPDECKAPGGAARLRRCCCFEGLRRRLRRLRRELPRRPPILCARRDPRVGRMEKLRDDICAAGRSAERRLQLAAPLPWFWALYRKWAARPSSRTKRARLPPARQLRLFLAHFEPGAPLLRTARRPLLFSELCPPQARRQLEGWMRQRRRQAEAGAAAPAAPRSPAPPPRKALRTKTTPPLRGRFDVVLAPLLQPCDKAEAFAALQRAAALVEEGGHLLVTLRSGSANALATTAWVLQAEELLAAPVDGARFERLARERVCDDAASAAVFERAELKDVSELGSLLLRRREL